MIRERVIVPLLLAGLWLVLGRPQARGQDVHPFRFGFSAASFSDVNLNDASAAVKVWARILATERGIPADPQPRIFRNLAAIESALTNGLVDAVNLTTQEYYALQDHAALQNFVFPIRGNSMTEEYVLLVHREAGFNKLADLKGRTLSVLKGPRATLAHAWLDTLLTEQGHPQIEDFFDQAVESSGITKTVLSVYFRKADACIVTRSGFETMLELSPKTDQHLKILAASPRLVTSVFGFRTGYASPVRKLILADIARWHTSPPGRQILNLFQCDRLEERPGSTLDTTVALLSNHFRLCGPHTPGGPAIPNPVSLLPTSGTE